MINALKWTLSSLLHMIKNVYKNCVHTKKLSASKNYSINKERIQYFTETRASRYFYQNYLDQVYFEVYMAYGSFRNSSGKEDLFEWLTNGLLKFVKKFQSKSKLHRTVL